MRNCLAYIVFSIFISNYLHAKPLQKPRIRRNAYRNESRLWPKGIVPYTLDEAYLAHEREVIEQAMKDIHSTSCIRFKRHSGEKAYVQIVREKGCRAVVGYIGRKQKLTLGRGCIWVARVLHELFHVLGFFHEHTRPDRDEYVTVHEGNIKPASLNNFRKMSPTKVTTFGLPYDYYSVLHYHDREFAIDRDQRTLEPTIGEPAIGKAVEMSKMDILKLNKLYRCPKKKKMTTKTSKKYAKEEDEGSGLTALENNYIIV